MNRSGDDALALMLGGEALWLKGCVTGALSCVRGGSSIQVLECPPVSRFLPPPDWYGWVSSSAEVASCPCPSRLSVSSLSGRSVVSDPPYHTVSIPFAPLECLLNNTALGGGILAKGPLADV